MKNTGKKQVCIDYRTTKNSLSGKVIDSVAFCNKPDSEQHFILTFTDGTFISIGVDYNEDSSEYILENDWLPSCHPENVNSGHLDSWIDSSGKLRFSKWVQDLIDLGIWEVTEEEVQDLIEKDKKDKEEREYNEYLRLKAKYEKPD